MLGVHIIINSCSVAIGLALSLRTCSGAVACNTEASVTDFVRKLPRTSSAYMREDLRFRRRDDWFFAKQDETNESKALK